MIGKNPCLFKRVCQVCVKVVQDERPSMCERMGCPEYKPCEKCLMNKLTVDFMGKKWCQSCVAKDPAVRNAQGSIIKKELKDKLRLELQEAMLGKGPPIPTEDEKEENKIQHLLDQQKKLKPILSIKGPGEVPDGCTDDERDYFIKRFEEYREYYRNPSSFFLCHQIILVEIYLAHINNRFIDCKGMQNFGLLQEQAQVSKILSEYKKMLPDAESEQMSDHERAMGVIYESYMAEKKKRYIGGVARLLSSAAIALNPVLHFKLDLPDIYKKLGINTEEAEDVLNRMEKNPDPNLSAEEIAEHFGFRIRKEFAIDEDDKNTSDILEDEEEDD